MSTVITAPNFIIIIIIIVISLLAALRPDGRIASYMQVKLIKLQ